MFFYTSGRIEQQLRSEYLRLATRGARATLFGLMVHGVFENGIVLTAFDAAEFTVILPYILMAIPFASQQLEGKGNVA